MNALPSASEPSSTEARRKDKSPTPAVDKTTESRLSKPLKHWFRRVVRATNEMATDEKVRKEVAKRLT